MSNCPLCNMYLAPGAIVCPNCQLNLQQYGYQQQVPHHHMMTPVTETVQEKKYRKLLIVLAIVALSELLVFRFPELMGNWFSFDTYSVMKPFRWLMQLAWAGVPLTIALVLPKTNRFRVLLIVFGAIYALWQVYAFVDRELSYSYDSFEYTNF